MSIIINGGLDILPAYELIISYQFLRVIIKKKLFCYLFCEFSFLIAIFGVCPGVRTCKLYFLFHLLVLGFSPCLMVSWLFCFLCFTSSVSLTGSYTKGQPKLEAPKMFCLVQFAEVLGSWRSTTRPQRQRHKFCISNEQKKSFARPSRAFIIFAHFFPVLDKSATWKCHFSSFNENVNTRANWNFLS